MKFTCFIAVCACLSTTVFTDEIKRLNRVKKTARGSREELIVKNARREINPTSQVYPDTVLKSQQFQPQIRIEKLKKKHEFQSGPQQQQQQQRRRQLRHNPGHPKHLTKRVKTRSIVGSSTYELNDNQLDSIPEVIPDEGPIRIEPVVRITKKNVFDSIFDIARQLLYPAKNELGPLVPIQIPGSKRKIYLRLIEPLDSSQVLVRFVTQLPVPVIDVEKQYNPYIPIPSIIDPTAAYVNHAYHGTIVPGKASFAASSNRHHAIYPPRNVSYVKGTQSIKSSAGNSSRNTYSKNKGNSLPAVISNAAEDDKNHFANTRVNLPNHEQQLLSQSAASYYQYQAAGEEVLDKVKELLEKQNATTTIESGGDSRSPSVQPWYQLGTHRLPFRQIAPYPVASSTEHDSGPGSYADTYKAPSDVLTGPSSYSISLYERYNDAANSTPVFYPSSYSGPSSYSTSYKQNEIHDFHPSTYPTSYHNENEFNNVPNIYSVPYQNQNEYNGSPNSYSVSPRDQNAYDSGSGLGVYTTSYAKQNDLTSAPSSYTISYAKPTVVSPSPSSYFEEQTGASSNEALRIIDPPSHLRGYQSDRANRSFERATTAIGQSRYNDPRETAASSIDGESTSRVIWGKLKRERNEKPSFQKSPEITGARIDDDREKWQPVTFVRENAGWREAYEAELAKATATTRQPILVNQSPKKTSRGGKSNQARQNAKHHGGAIAARDPRCSTASEDRNGCDRAKSTTPRSASTVRIVEKQGQSSPDDNKPIAKSTTSNTIETSNPNVIKSSTTAISSPFTATTIKTPESKSDDNGSGTTEKSLLVIKIIKHHNVTTTERPPLLIKAVENIFTTGRAEKLTGTEASITKTTKPTKSTKSIVNDEMRKLTTNDATEKTSGTIEKSSMKDASVSSGKTGKPELPKRPMVMKKLTSIMMKSEMNVTTMRTVRKATISSTTGRTTPTVARKPRISNAKSSTT